MGGDPVAKYSIELGDDVSGAAETAAGALTRLKDKIGQDTKALSEMRRAMRNLKGATGVSSTEIQKLQFRIDAQRASIGSAQRGFLKLGGTFGKVAPKTLTQSSALERVTGSLGSAGGMAARLGSGMSRLGSLLANPLMLITALSAALAAFTAATLTAVTALITYGVAQSGARRAEALRLEGLNTLRVQYGRTTGSVEGMQAAIDRASDATGLGRSQLEGYTRSLTRVGLRGEALAQALEGTAIAASVQGERGAARFRALAVNAAITGGSIRDLTNEYRNRLGPIARRTMLSLDNQSRRVRMGLERIFSGLRIETFLGAISEITDQFRQTSVSGRALKSLVEGIFQPLLDSSVTLGPVLRRLFQGMIIGALKVGIAFLLVRNAVRDAFGNNELFSNAQLMSAALKIGTAVVIGLAAAFVGLVAVGALVVGAFTLVAAIITGIVALPTLMSNSILSAMQSIATALFPVVERIRSTMSRIITFFTNTNFAMLAGRMVSGLVVGIRSGVGRLTSEVSGLASGVSDTFRSALGISSPSRVFAGFGLNIAQGVTRGVQRGQAETNDAVGGLVGAPSGGATIGGSATSISVGDVQIQAGETSNPRELARAFRDELASVLEGLNIEVGAT